MTGGCPAPAELMPYALGRPGEPVPENVAGHVRACPSCGAEVRRLRETASALRATDSGLEGAGACLDELAIASVVDGGGLTDAQRPDVIAHLTVCSRCRDQLASVARLLRDPSVGAAQQSLPKPTLAHGAEPRSRRRSRRLAAVSGLTGLAAAIVLVAIRFDAPARARTSEPPARGPSVHREQSVTTTGSPRLLTPTGVVASADTLRWTSVPHADRYRVTVFDRDGNVAIEAQTADTTLALPAAAGVARGRLYLWKVEARTGWDRWVESEFVEFTVSSPPERER